MLHSKVDFTVAVEGAGTFGVAGEGRDKVGVFDLPIDIPREGAEGKVAVEILRNYLKRKDRNISRLMDYAKQMRVLSTMRQYLEMGL